MKLVSFSALNYRSITKAHKLPIGDLTVLIGPNNEGKSNVLRALVTALQIVEGLGTTGIFSIFRGRIRDLEFPLESPYDWSRDFPIQLQSSKSDGESVFNLEFELSDDEIVDFHREVRSNLNGSLPIQISIGRKEPGFKVTKKGPGAAALSKKAKAIAQFIGKRLALQYIPAVRTAESARRVVERAVERELATLDGNADFKKAVAEIERLQRPILEKISAGIRETLVEFLPAVKGVEVKISEGDRFRALRRSCQIVVDDGSPTDLKHKGDGVQSLAALSLLRRPLVAAKTSPEQVLAIEEPESHLHPRAIHQLRSVLEEMAGRQQIIMTTHCPLFVDRERLRSNIVVTDTKASPARSVAQIRDVLGIRPADNLRNAELVLVVEGDDDRSSLGALIGHFSLRLRSSLKNGVLAIDSLSGAGNLAYKLSQLRTELYGVHVLLDDDEAGRSAASKARSQGLLVSGDENFTVCPGMIEAELEDLLDEDLYREAFEARFGLKLMRPHRGSARKWSDRMKEVFRQQGKRWDARVTKEAKQLVAESVVADPARALHSAKRGSIDGLIAQLERRISQQA